MRYVVVDRFRIRLHVPERERSLVVCFRGTAEMSESSLIGRTLRVHPPAGDWWEHPISDARRLGPDLFGVELAGQHERPVEVGWECELTE